VPDLNNKTNAFVPYLGPLGSLGFSSAFNDAAQVRVSPENGPIFLNVLEVDVVSMPGGEPLGLYDRTQNVLDEVMMWVRGLYNTMNSSESSLSALQGRLGVFFATILKLRKEQITALVILMIATEDQESFESINAETATPLMESLRSIAHFLKSHFASRGSTYILLHQAGAWDARRNPFLLATEFVLSLEASIYTSSSPHQVAMSLALQSLA
jgi:hypothetical protein